MSNELDTSWFDLKKYDKLKELDLSDWYFQLSMRSMMKRWQEEHRLHLATPRIERLKKIPIINSDFHESLLSNFGKTLGKALIENSHNSIFLKNDSCNSKYPFNTYSVESTTALDYWLQVNNERLSDIWTYCESYNTRDSMTPDELSELKTLYKLHEVIGSDGKPINGSYTLDIEWNSEKTQKANDILMKQDKTRNAAKEQDELIRTPLNLLLNDRGSYYQRFNAVTVDLTATDEQIMSDFNHWLTEYRKLIGSGEQIKKQYELNKNNFNNNDCLDWAESQVLPYIDLMLIAELEGKKMTQAKIGELIFPNEYSVDLAGKIRQTTKPKADWLLKKSTLKAIDAQIRSAL